MATPTTHGTGCVYGLPLMPLWIGDGRQGRGHHGDRGIDAQTCSSCVAGMLGYESYYSGPLANMLARDQASVPTIGVLPQQSFGPSERFGGHGYTSGSGQGSPPNMGPRMQGSCALTDRPKSLYRPPATDDRALFWNWGGSRALVSRTKCVEVRSWARRGFPHCADHCRSAECVRRSTGDPGDHWVFVVG